MRERSGEGRVGFEAGDDFLAVFDQVGHAGLREDIGTAVHLRVDSDEDALDRVAVEVGGDVYAVRQFTERLDGGSALVVHQHKVDDARVVSDRHRANERLDQFGFARAGRAGRHAVHAIGLGLEHHIAGVLAAHKANGRAQPFLILRQHTALPSFGDVQIADAHDGFVVDQREHVEQGERARQFARWPLAAHGEPNLLHALADFLIRVGPVSLVRVGGRAGHAHLELQRVGLVLNDHGQQTASRNVVEIGRARTDNVAVHAAVGQRKRVALGHQVV